MAELNLTYNAEKMELTISPIDSQRMRNIKEVVRCKDCKHWTTHDNEYGECIHRHWIIEGETNAVTSHDDFCSYGERREKGDCSKDTSSENA